VCEYGECECARHHLYLGGITMSDKTIIGIILLFADVAFCLLDQLFCHLKTNQTI